jgi:hypothetical protein
VSLHSQLTEAAVDSRVPGASRRITTISETSAHLSGSSPTSASI